MKKIFTLVLISMFTFSITKVQAMESPKVIRAYEEPYFIQSPYLQQYAKGKLISYKGKEYIPLRDAANFLGLSIRIDSGNIYLNQLQERPIRFHLGELPKQAKAIQDDYTVNPKIDALAGLVVENQNFKFPVFSKNANHTLYPASTTKVMTALLAIEKGVMTDFISVKEEVTMIPKDSSKAGIQPGDQLTLKQLLYAMLLPSGNDAAVAIAQHIGGTEENFTKMMTKRAKELGAKQTNFTNAHGYHHPDLYTTASDLALIVGEAARHPLFMKVAGTPSYRTTYVNQKGERVKKEWKNTNEIIQDETNHYSPWILAGKTGYTEAAQHNLVTISKKGEHHYITILLKGHRTKRYADTKRLLKAAYNQRIQMDRGKTRLTISPFPYAIYFNQQRIDKKQDVFLYAGTTYIAIDRLKDLSPNITHVELAQALEYKVNLQNELLLFEQGTTKIQEGRLLVPARSFLEKVGLQLTWNKHTKMLYAFSEELNIHLGLNERVAIVNGERILLDVPLTLKNGRVLVPLRFITEVTGHPVDWGIGRTLYLQ